MKTTAYETLLSTTNYADGRSFARAANSRLLDFMVKRGILEREEAAKVKAEHIRRTGQQMTKKTKKKKANSGSQ